MRITSILVLLAFALGLPASAFAQHPVRSAGFQAYLFNSRTGALSGDMLAKDAPIPDKARIRLLATESGFMPFAANRGKASSRVMLDSTSGLGPVSAEGAPHAGFWLAGTGCRSISLKASSEKPQLGSGNAGCPSTGSGRTARREPHPSGDHKKLRSP